MKDRDFFFFFNIRWQNNRIIIRKNIDLNMKSETIESGKTYDNIFATLEFIKTS